MELSTGDADFSRSYMARRRLAGPPRSRQKGESLASIALKGDPLDFLADRPTRIGLLTRRELLGVRLRGDGKLSRQLAGALFARQRPDGSWNGSVYESGWALWQLADLGVAKDSAKVQAGVEWLYGQQDVEGAYRASERLGFFGSAPPSRGRELQLFTGDRIGSEVARRFQESNYALRTLLRLGRGRDSEVRRHLESLHTLVGTDGWYCCGSCMLSALQAFAHDPRPEPPPTLQRGLQALGQRQRPDGTWKSLPFYLTVDTLRAAQGPVAERQLHRALPRLTRAQRRNGTWGLNSTREELTYLAARTLDSLGLLTQLRKGKAVEL